MNRLLLVAILGAGPVVADDDSRFYREPPLDFSLRLSRHSLDLDYGGTTIDTAVDRIGVAWREQYGQRLQLGLAVGYSFLTQDNNPVTAGRELDGYHVGVSADFALLTTDRVTLFAGAAWMYQRVDDDNGTQRAVIAWGEPQARLGASGLLVGALRAYGGLRYGRINGQQRLSGDINETRKIEEADRSGAFAGLELGLENDGYVGVHAQSGVDRGGTLSFGRRF